MKYIVSTKGKVYTDKVRSYSIEASSKEDAETIAKENSMANLRFLLILKL